MVSDTHVVALPGSVACDAANGAAFAGVAADEAVRAVHFDEARAGRAQIAARGCAAHATPRLWSAAGAGVQRAVLSRTLEAGGGWNDARQLLEQCFADLDLVVPGLPHDGRSSDADGEPAHELEVGTSLVRRQKAPYRLQVHDEVGEFHDPAYVEIPREIQRMRAAPELC